LDELVFTDCPKAPSHVDDWLICTLAQHGSHPTAHQRDIADVALDLLEELVNVIPELMAS